MKTLTRLPWAPLGRVLAGIEVDRQPAGDSLNLLSRITGVDSRQLARLQHTGLTYRAADQICRRIERHPAEIWAEWFDLEAVA